MAGGPGVGGAGGARRRLSTRGWPRRGTARRPPSRPRCPRTCPAQPARSPVGRGSVSLRGHGPLCAPSHGDVALLCPIPHGHGLRVPHPTGYNPRVPHHHMGRGFWHPPSHREGSCRNLALGIPHSPMGTQPSLPPVPYGDSHQCAPNGDVVLGIPPAVGHSPRCLLSACGTWPLVSSITLQEHDSWCSPSQGHSHQHPLPMGTWPSVSPTTHRDTAFRIPSHGGRPHHLCALDKLLSGGGGVVLLPAPGAERRRLQRPPVGEGEGPRPHQRARVDGIEVDGGLLLTLPPGQEGDTCREQGYGTKGTTRHPPAMISTISTTCWWRYLARPGARCGAGR